MATLWRLRSMRGPEDQVDLKVLLPPAEELEGRSSVGGPPRPRLAPAPAPYGAASSGAPRYLSLHDGLVDSFRCQPAVRRVEATSVTERRTTLLVVLAPATLPIAAVFEAFP